MKGSRQLVLSIAAVAAIAAVASLVLSQLDQVLSQWFLRVEMPEVRLRFTRWVAAPLLAGLCAGSFATALFRTKRAVLPLTPALALLAVMTFSWLRHSFGFSFAGLVASDQWRALLICLPAGALLGVIVVRRLYPAGRG